MRQIENHNRQYQPFFQVYDSAGCVTDHQLDNVISMLNAERDGKPILPSEINALRDDPIKMQRFLFTHYTQKGEQGEFYWVYTEGI